MKSNYLIIFTLLTSLLIGACEKPNPPAPTPPPIDVEQDTIFELLWATRMDMEKEIVNLANGISYKEWFIYSGDLGNPPTIMAFNKETGNKDWTLIFDQLPGYEIDYMFLSGNFLLARNSCMVFAINLESQKLVWSVNIKNMNMRLGTMNLASNNKLYLEADFGFHSTSQVQHLFEFDVVNGDYKIVYSISHDTVGSKEISPPVYVSIDNKNIIIFNEYPNADSPPEDDLQNIVAIDLDNGELIWRTESFTENFYSNALHPPIIYDNRIVITGGDWSIYAFDVHTGKQLWRYAFDYPWSIWNKTNHLIYKDRLYVNNGQFDVTCLNPETGALIWNNPKGGPNCTENMVYYEKEDLLVFTSWGYGSVMVLDALTGKTVHRERPYDNSQFNNDVVYDKERDMFFTCTFKHAIGFKIHKPK